MSVAAPRVSVVVPVYNSGRFLASTIEAVLAQTYTDFEVVVSDDASADDSMAIVERFGDPRIRVLRNDSNLGAVGNWNRGMAEARGSFIKLLCADDLLYPTCLERQAAVLDDPAHAGVSLVTAPHDVVDDADKRIVARGFRAPGRMPAAQAIRRIARSGTNLVGEPSAAMFRAEAFAAVGPWVERARYVVDLDMWMRLLTTGDLYVVGETLTAFRVHRGSWSSALSHTQTDDMRWLLERMADDPAYPVTSADARMGTARAWVNTQLRHLFYRVFLRDADISRLND